MKKKSIMFQFIVVFLTISILLYGCEQQPKEPTTPPTTPEGVNSVVNANNQFSLEFYSNLKDKEGNIFFSPYSISTALAMAYEGAREHTAKEIQSVFHFPEDNNLRRASFAAVYNQLNQKDAKYKLSTANALWVQQDFKLLDGYTNTIQEYYSGKATNVDFVGAAEKTRQTINSWVEDKTNNKIKNLFPPGSLTPLSRLVLTNAIYFKGTWVKQFDKSDTKDEDFRVSSDKTVKVPMMRKTGKDAKFSYTETDDLQILEMIYEGHELSMLVLLPKNEDLTSIEESLTVEKLDGWKNELREQRVDLFMPKFTFTTKYTLNNNLKEMGMPSAFSTAADFSGIDGTKNLFIQIVVHQAFVDVNEEGTEAAAATGVGVGITSLPPPVPIFRADHPFIFIIQEKKSGIILFFGRVIDPTK
ncbi:MAG: serpin family protein [Nanoarchaeota archaeon]